MPATSPRNRAAGRRRYGYVLGCGSFVKVKPREMLSAAAGDKEECRNKIMELQSKRIEAHETIIALSREKAALMEELAGLRGRKG